jgi:hypothetical protein
MWSDRREVTGAGKVKISVVSSAFVVNGKDEDQGIRGWKRNAQVADMKRREEKAKSAFVLTDFTNSW